MWCRALKKEYVVTEISASPDGSPYVFVSLKGPGEVGGPQRTPVRVAAVGSLEEMLQNLSKQMMGGFKTVIKLGLEEYEKLDIKVGDRVSLDISKIQVGIP